MSDVEELGKTIGLSIRKQQNMQQTMTRPGTLSTYFLMPTYRVKIQTTRCKTEHKTIGTAFILGHSDNAVLGTSALGAGTMGGWTEIETLYDIQDITNYGKNYVRDWLYSGTDYPNYIIVGGGDTAFSTDQTDLITPIGITDEDSSDNSTDAIGTLIGEFKSTDYYATEKFPITRGLISWWRLDEKVGTTIKDSWGTNTGTSVNDTSTMTIAGKVGNALDFNGTTDSITVTSPSLPTTAITVSAWVKVGTHKNWNNFINNNWTVEGDWLLFSSDTAWIWGIRSAGAAQESVSVAHSSSTAWTHLVGTYDGTTQRFYVNGIAVGTPVTHTTTLTENNLAINASVDGAIDEVCIFNRAFSTTEVTALYDSSVLAYGQTINEIGIVAGGRHKFNIDTSLGGQIKNVTINTEESS